MEENLIKTEEDWKEKISRMKDPFTILEEKKTILEQKEKNEEKKKSSGFFSSFFSSNKNMEDSYGQKKDEKEKIVKKSKELQLEVDNSVFNQNDKFDGIYLFGSPGLI